MSNHQAQPLARSLFTPFAVAALFGLAGCVAEETPDIAMFDTEELTGGVTQAGLWQATTLEYCFQRPILGEMPSSVRSVVPSQAHLDARFERRKNEFIGAINTTWQAAGVLDLVPRATCGTGMLVVRYNRDTPTGGYAGIGRNGGLSIGIQMDSEFLGSTYTWGAGTYHTFVAAHEFGHILGFRHEQDRTDSTCHESQDFSGTGIALTGYDASSVMNYCARQVTGLTSLDKQGYERAYAFLFADDPGSTETCQDRNQWCNAWANSGECSRNPGYMVANCCVSCNARAPRVVARNSGKCMDVDARGTANGTNIQQYTCNGTGAQAFVVRTQSDGSINLVNVNSGKCVDATRSGLADGTNIQLYACNGTAAQRFQRRDAGAGFVTLVNVNSGKCVDVDAWSSADRANIHLWSCHGGANQQWRIE
jgi:hypothetical protein